VGTTPDELKADIEQTRANLARNTDLLADKVRPSSVIHRRTEAVKGGFTSLKDRVMGGGSDMASDFGDRASSMGSSVSGKASDVASSASDTASNVASTVSDAASRAPQQLRRQTQGSPLGAGLIAFGAGLLVAGLIPASEREQQAATQLKERAEPVLDRVKEEAKSGAGELKEQLAPQAQQAVEAVKQTASDAAQQTADDAKGAAADVRGSATDAVQDVRETASGDGVSGDTSAPAYAGEYGTTSGSSY